MDDVVWLWSCESVCFFCVHNWVIHSMIVNSLIIKWNHFWLFKWSQSELYYQVYEAACQTKVSFTHPHSPTLTLNFLQVWNIQLIEPDNVCRFHLWKGLLSSKYDHRRSKYTITRLSQSGRWLWEQHVLLTLKAQTTWAMQSHFNLIYYTREQAKQPEFWTNIK